MSKDERILEREKNKAGETAEHIIKRNLEKIKRLKNPNSEVTSHEIKLYLSNSSKHPFPLDNNRKRNDGGKRNTVIPKNHHSLNSQSEESELSRNNPNENSGSEIHQDEEKSSLKDRKSKSTISKPL